MSSRSFDGVNQYLRKINMPSSIRSMAGWGKTATVGTQFIMECEHWTGIPPSFNTSFEIVTVASAATNKLAANITDTVGASGAVTTTSMTINTWFHWAVTIDPTNINVYVNGGGKASAVYSESLQIWRRHAVGASWVGGAPFNGQIAHVATWGRALSDAEILALYEARCPPMDVSMGGAASGGLAYYAPLEHDDLCQFGAQTTGAQLVFGPINAPTFSDLDPNVYPMLGGIVAA